MSKTAQLWGKAQAGFLKYRALTAGEMIAGLEKELCDFSLDETPFDDITLLVIKRTA